MRFQDRQSAGVALARRLEDYAGRQHVTVLALPRGGVVIGAEVAEHLCLPLNVVITRKIGAPSNEEFAVGAVAETGEIVLNQGSARLEDQTALQKVILKEIDEIDRRISVYRAGQELPDMHGETVLLVDDGVATGYTMQAAIAAAKHRGAARVVVAVPHGAPESLAQLRAAADDVITLHEPQNYGAVGQFYDEFFPVSDKDVLALLAKHKTPRYSGN